MITNRMLSTKFDPGRLVATPTALRAIPERELFFALQRHLNCDWGDVCEADKRSNTQALKTGERLFSAYHTSDDLKFWIITEADRSATTVLLPQDY